MLAVMRFRRWIDDLPDSDQSLIDADRLSRLAVELDKNDSTCISIRRFVCGLRRSFDFAAQTLILGTAIATRGVGANSNPEARSWPIDHVHGPSAVRNA